MYVMTNARLGGEEGADWERRLTRHLRPVREVLDVKGMEFDQLLQRDLDDHRVANDLVPYLLGQPTQDTSGGGPAFFPPILAVLLPGNMGGAHSTFRSPLTGAVTTVNGLPFTETRFGSAFVVRQLLLEPGDDPTALHPICYGTVDWSDDQARLVVIDGQHRAMALLAIERTRRGTWEDSGGARYRHFYEKRVQDALATHPDAMVQVPVTVCWFPDLVDDDIAPVQAARKLFVDVNKRAKRPSEDRVILLSDDDLVNIFTQSLLNHLPRQARGLPLFAVEYDSPKTHRGPGRWSVVTTLQSLNVIIERLVFGPAKYVESVDEEIRGRPPDDDGSFLRKQLVIEEVLAATTLDEDQAIQRGAVTRKLFPRSKVNELRRAFDAGWGDAIIGLFAETAPYRSHATALVQLYDETPASTAVEQLAREAVFEGVGMYWTLNDSAQSWVTQQRADPLLEKTDVYRAWELVEEQQRQFSRLRSVEYLGSVADLRLSDHLFNDVFKTQACQLGLALTLGTIAHLADIRDARLPQLASQLAAALNDSIGGTSDSGQRLRTAFAKTDAALTIPTLNSIFRMETARAIQFRYFWLELLMRSPSLDDRFAPYVDRAVLARQRDRGRRRFLLYRIGEQTRALQSLRPEATTESLQPQATALVIAQLGAALEAWFDVTAEQWQEWIGGFDDLAVPVATEADGEDSDEGEGDSES